MAGIEAAYEKIFNNELLNKVIDDLTYNQFLQGKNFSSAEIVIPFNHLKKSIWLCSILAESINGEHRKKVQLFASLVYLQNQSNIDIERCCFLLSSRVGNLPATRLFNNFSKYGQIEDNLSNSFDALLNFELAVEWNDKSISAEPDRVITSRFQKDLWNILNTGSRISISAPTSAGKSFIIKKYIKRILNKKEEFKVLYIVPSKALINQVSEEFRKEVNLKDVEVKTAFLEEIDNFKKQEIYVLTAERCLRLIQQALIQQNFKLDLIFIDEIQNVEDEDGRGSLLEYVLKELHTIFFHAQIIIAGPNINNTSDLFRRIFGEVVPSIETSVSPVFQIKTIVRPIEDQKLNITLKNISGREQSFEITTDIDFKKRINKSYAEGISPFIDLFSSNQQNIIYSPRTDYVEHWALAFIKETQKNDSSLKEQETQELIEFLQEEIHPKYYLIRCLEKNAAFHHSKLPDIVRKEIEDGFLEGRITNLFCTSTLLEGVNLPANNLFIVSPKKLNVELSPFEFGNLIGRAGRIKDSLYGTIYCIERDTNDSWAEEYYDKTYQKDVQSVTDKSLSVLHEFINELEKPIEEIKEAKHSNTIIFLRHKFLNNVESLEEYLRNKNLTTLNVDTILQKLSSSLKGVSIPNAITRLNPSIDPKLQDELYLNILKYGIEEWAITPNPNFYGKIRKEDKEGYTFQNTSLFWQLVSIMERLDKIFDISREVYFKHNISASIRQVCFYGIRWLNSTSYREIIESDIAFYGNHSNLEKRINPLDEEAINLRINEVIKINSTLVSYILVKYLKLVNDIMEPLMSDEQKVKYKFSLALPTMLELGSSENTVKILISRGVSRSVAIKIWQEFKKVKGHEDIDVFDWLKTQDKLNLKPIYNRYLKRMKILKNN